MLTYNNIVFANGIEEVDNIRYVSGWATEKIMPAELVITYWDSDGIELTDKASNTSYYVRVWNWVVKGKKRITVTATWTLFKANEDNGNARIDVGFVEIRNGKVFGGTHTA